jgi:medium-chain acyl-[acyl-carrier-protein] hydrolase
MYTFSSRVRYSELNHHKGSMDISSIINYFQDCSTFQSEDMQRGLSYLEAKNRVWFLNSWHVLFYHPVFLGDLITIGTWAYDFNGFYGYRNFIMKNDSDEVLAAADSLWVYMDFDTGHPCRIPPDHGGYQLEPPYPIKPVSRKIHVPSELTSYPSFPVTKSNIDSYHHVNNCQYIKMAEEFLPDNLVVTQMRVEYKNQAVLGDTILPGIAFSNNCYTIVLSDPAHKPYAIIEFLVGTLK